MTLLQFRPVLLLQPVLCHSCSPVLCHTSSSDLCHSCSPGPRHSCSHGLCHSSSPDLCHSCSPGLCHSSSLGLCHSCSSDPCHSCSPGLCHFPGSDPCHSCSPGLCRLPSPGLCHSSSPGLCHLSSPGLCHSSSPGLCHFSSPGLSASVGKRSMTEAFMIDDRSPRPPPSCRRAASPRTSNNHSEQNVEIPCRPSTLSFLNHGVFARLASFQTLCLPVPLFAHISFSPCFWYHLKVTGMESPPPPPPPPPHFPVPFKGDWYGKPLSLSLPCHLKVTGTGSLSLSPSLSLLFFVGTTQVTTQIQEDKFCRCCLLWIPPLAPPPPPLGNGISIFITREMCYIFILDRCCLFGRDWTSGCFSISVLF